MDGSTSNLGTKGKGAVLSPNHGVGLHRLLAPIDFSPASQHGLAFAGAVAERFHSAIQVVYAVEPPVLPEWGYAHIPLREAKLRHEAQERIPQFLLECDLDPKLIESSTIRTGDAATEICKTAVQEQTDLIVIASHGLGSLQHGLLGSTVERVVRHAPCPVLTVRDRTLRREPPRFNLKRLVVTTDFSEASRRALPYAVAFAQEFEGSLVLLHVVRAHLPAEIRQFGVDWEEGRCLEDAQERMLRFRQAGLGALLHVETLVRYGNPAHEICRTAKAQGADLIIMATRGQTSLKHFLLGSVTEKVVRHAPCPVLAVREQEHDFVGA